MYQNGSWTLDSATTFVYDGWDLIQETTTKGGNIETASYVWGLDVSGTLHGAGGIGGLLSRHTTDGTFLYLYDLNGNVGQLVHAETGELAARYEYDPFGKALVASGLEAETNPFRFSTKFFDIETGLSYYGYRYYSPRLGRWTTRDPFGEAGGKNLYVFVKNNSISAWDYLGYYTLEEAARKEYERQHPYDPSRVDPMSGNDPMTEWDNKFMYYYSKLLPQERFDLWYKWEKNQIDTIGEWWNDLPRCPKKLCISQNKPQNPNAALWENPSKPKPQEFALHPGSAWSLRSMPDINNHTNQCTYDEHGELLLSPPGSGTVDWFKSATMTHYAHDVEPIYLANSLDGGKKMSLAPWGPMILLQPGTNMRKYYEVRPLYAEE